LRRRESRGLHFSRDYPDMLAQPKPTILESREKELH
jgi:L-aspartate oxidase